MSGHLDKVFGPGTESGLQERLRASLAEVEGVLGPLNVRLESEDGYAFITVRDGSTPVGTIEVVAERGRVWTRADIEDIYCGIGILTAALRVFVPFLRNLGVAEVLHAPHPFDHDGLAARKLGFVDRDKEWLRLDDQRFDDYLRWKTEPAWHRELRETAPLHSAERAGLPSSMAGRLDSENWERLLEYSTWREGDGPEPEWHREEDS